MTTAAGPDPERSAPLDRERSQTLDRGLALLGSLAEREGGATVTELARDLGVARPVVYRMLATLETWRLARRGDDGRVRLGLGVLALAGRVQPLLREAATPVLRTLADEVGATAHLTLADGDQALAVVVVEPSSTPMHVAYRVGTRHPLDRGAAGRAIGAALAAGHGCVTAALASDGELQQGAHGVAAGWSTPVLAASVGVVSLGPLDQATAGPAVERAAASVAARLDA